MWVFIDWCAWCYSTNQYGLIHSDSGEMLCSGAAPHAILPHLYFLLQNHPCCSFCSQRTEPTFKKPKCDVIESSTCSMAFVTFASEISYSSRRKMSRVGHSVRRTLLWLSICHKVKTEGLCTWLTRPLYLWNTLECSTMLQNLLLRNWGVRAELTNTAGQRVEEELACSWEPFIMTGWESTANFSKVIKLCKNSF